MERDNHELIAADSITFTKFLTAVAARTGEMLNYKNIAGDVGVSEPTIKKLDFYSGKNGNHPMPY